MHINIFHRLPARLRVLTALFTASFGALSLTMAFQTAAPVSLTALFWKDVVPVYVKDAVITTEQPTVTRETLRAAHAAAVRRARERQITAVRSRMTVGVVDPEPVAVVRIRVSRLSPPSSSSSSSQAVRPAAPEEPENTQTVFAPRDTTPFPSFGKAALPVSRIPNWGAMRSSAEWDRRYEDMLPSDFVPVPSYNLEHLTQPMHMLSKDLQEGNIPIVTEKLFYATRFFGRYNTDSNEFEGDHPGIDLKLAPGTPVSAIASGRVNYAGTDPYLGNYVMIEHQLPDTGERVVSVYGHLESLAMREGQDVKTGDFIGRVGSTGRSSGPHLHLQIDYKREPGRHQPYIPGSGVTRSEAALHTLHPITFIERYRASR